MADLELDAAAILAAEDLEPVKVPVPEWGGHVYLRPLSADEGDAYNAQEAELREGAEAERDWYRGYRTRLVAAHACDAAGELLFTPDQVEELGRKNAAVIEHLAEHAGEISAQNEEKVKALGKGSGEAPGDGSS